MATIYYSMAGEGRGHATRVRAVVDRLSRLGHRLVLFAPHAAYQLLTQRYNSAAVSVRRIPGLCFHYHNHRLDARKTLRYGIDYLRRLPAIVGFLERVIRREAPDLVITDFEPALPRAALRCGIPFISLDHQHFLVANDLRHLPYRLRCWAWLMGQFVRRFYRGQVRTVVSSFYSAPLRPQWRHVEQIGVLLRDEVTHAVPRNDGHLVGYFRRVAPRRVLESLKACGRRIKLYGLGQQPAEANLSFHAIDERQFLSDLGSCNALICTAGNQLVGEALYLSKPVLAMPEPNNHEQQINGHFLAESGCGRTIEMQKLRSTDVLEFLDRAEEYRQRTVTQRRNGVDQAVAIICEQLAADKPDRGGSAAVREGLAHVG